MDIPPREIIGRLSSKNRDCTPIVAVQSALHHFLYIFGNKLRKCPALKEFRHISHRLATLRFKDFTQGRSGNMAKVCDLRWQEKSQVHQACCTGL
jgi:hypothetical protein